MLLAELVRVLVAGGVSVRVLVADAGRLCVAVLLRVADPLALAVGALLAVLVRVLVAGGVSVRVLVTDAVRVCVAVRLRVTDAVGLAVGICVRVGVSVGVILRVSVRVGVGVRVGVDVTLALRANVRVAVRLAVGVCGSGVGVYVGAGTDIEPGRFDQNPPVKLYPAPETPASGWLAPNSS